MIKYLLLPYYMNRITIKNDSLIVVSEDGNKKEKIEIKPNDISFDRIILFPFSGYISFKAITFLIENKIFVLFLDRYGNLKSELHPIIYPFRASDIKKNQYLMNDSMKMHLSKEIIKGKIKKQKEFLEGLEENWNIDSFLEKIEQSATKKRVLGIEAGVTKQYWERYKKYINPDYEFRERTGRKKGLSHPKNAKDKFNSLLNFSYSLLAGEITRACYGTGFDVYKGFFHKEEMGFKPFVYDVIEPFRFLSERACLSLSFDKDLLRKGFYKDREGSF